MKKRPTEIALAASSRSASSSTMQGSEPPSSSTTFLRCAAAAAITCLPVGVEPVSATLRISGWLTIAWPVPGPRTTFTTPSGSPPSISASMQRSVASGVVEDGFSTTAFPAAIAGATLFAASVSGKFQGTIAPVTPIGLRTTSPYCVLSGSVSGVNVSKRWRSCRNRGGNTGRWMATVPFEARKSAIRL